MEQMRRMVRSDELDEWVMRLRRSEIEQMKDKEK